MVNSYKINLIPSSVDPASVIEEGGVNSIPALLHIAYISKKAQSCH